MFIVSTLLTANVSSICVVFYKYILIGLNINTILVSVYAI